VYSINPGLPLPFDAYCDMTDGGWTVIQRRVNGTLDFNKGWAEFVAGFGDLTGNYWAGLDRMHALTSQTCPMMLHVSMR
jgi:ficolin